MTAPHALLIAFGYPPCRGSGVHRALGLSQALVDQGFRVSVLTVDLDFWELYTGADESLLSRIPAQAQIIRVPFAWTHLDGDLRTWPKSRLLAPAMWRRHHVAQNEALFPEYNYANLIEPFVDAAMKLHSNDAVDVVISTANPFATFEVAYELNTRLGIPYVLDYRDAWTLDMFEGTLSESATEQILELESKYIASSQEVWFVNEGLVHWHQERYPANASKMKNVPNAWDEPRVEASILGRDPNREIKFGFVGTVTPVLPMEEFASAVEHVAQENLIPGAHSVHFYGPHGFFTSRNTGPTVENGITFHGRLNKDEISAAYNDLDVLLFLVSGGPQGSQFITSGKVFEYLSSGMPIVSVHDPGSDAVNYLRDYPLWFDGGGLEPEGIAKAMVRAADYARNPSAELAAEAVEYANRFRRDQVLSKPVSELKKAIR